MKPQFYALLPWKGMPSTACFLPGAEELIEFLPDMEGISATNDGEILLFSKAKGFSQ